MRPGMRLCLNEDGSVTIYLTHESPSPDKQANWLLTPDRRSVERCFQRAKKLGHPKADQALEWLGSGS